MSNLFKILLVEDNPSDVWSIQEKLEAGKVFDYHLIQVQCLEAAITILDREIIDVILLDLFLPDSEGLETLKKMAAKASRIPIIILTGINDENLAIQAIAQEAENYLVKENIREDILVLTLRYTIENKRITDQLKTLTLQLEAKDRELEAIRYIVSHDLSNPLTAIIGLAQLLEQKYEHEPTKDTEKLYLKHICNASERMGQIVTDLLLRLDSEDGQHSPQTYAVYP